MKDKLARWYRQGLWTAAMVQEAVEKGLITLEDYVEIVGAEES
jgi:predicted DNA-binding protein